MQDLPKADVLIVAAEASSELYASRILEEVKSRGLSLNFFGIGSQRMEDLGCEIIEKSENMAVVGFWEVLAHWKTIVRAFKGLVRMADKRKPSMALLLDYPDFNLRLAKKLKHRSVPVIYYISPQIWAWRQSRVHLIKKIVSKMLVVFPFEKEFYEKFRMPVKFVGHPLLDEVKKTSLDADKRQQVRQKLGIAKDDFLVALLPGSRHSELKYNFRTQIQTALSINAQRPKTQFLILVAPTLNVSDIKKLIPLNFTLPLRVVKDDPLRILQASDVALVASGTATLVTGLAETPMVIMYKMNILTGFLAKFLVKGPKFFGMANLIMNEKVAPEFFQKQANPVQISNEMIRYIDDEPYREATKAKLRLLKEKLGGPGATKLVVDSMIEIMNQKKVLK